MTTTTSTTVDRSNIRYNVQVSHPDGVANRRSVRDLLARPLRGKPYCPEHMWKKHGLHPLAWEEHPNEHCALIQLCEVATTRDSGVQKCDEFGTPLGPRHQLMVPGFTKGQLGRISDEAFAQLYPGRPTQTEEEKEQDRQAQLRAAEQDRELLKKVRSIAHALNAYLYRNGTKTLAEVELHVRNKIKGGNKALKAYFPDRRLPPCHSS